MALFPAFAVDGGDVPAEMLRRALYASTNGANGIVTPTDLRVTALSTPGAAVNVAPGSGLAVSRFPGAAKTQTYEIAIGSTYQVSIPATTGTGRTDYIIARVHDPEFEDYAPADPTTDNYWDVVRVSSIANLNYPFVPLAKLTIPANTATITSLMIADLREVANPRTLRVIRPNAIVTAETERQTATRDDGEWWPNAGGVQAVDIPTWAVKVKIRAEVFMVLYDAPSWGRVWVGWGPTTARPTRNDYNSQEFGYDAPNSTGNSRGTITVVDEMTVPASMRGTTQPFGLFARRVGGAAGSGPVADSLTGTSMELVFEEIADSSTS